MRSVYKRELLSYFVTAAGYAFLFVFLVLSGLVFYFNNLAALSADLSRFFPMLSYLWMLLSPVLTMRLLSEEKKSGTAKLLLTAPISKSAIVLGKYLAACTVMISAILLSFMYPLLVATRAYVYWPEVFVAYLGLLLQGLAFLAIDLFLSSLTASPSAAFAFAFGGNLILWLIGIADVTAAPALFKELMRVLNLYNRYVPFISGQLSFANVFYFLLIVVWMLWLTVRSIGRRKWVIG